MAGRRRRKDVYEIPDSDQDDQSDDDTPPTDELDPITISPSRSTASSSEHSFIDIEKHFPRGRGLFLRIPSAVEVEAPTALHTPSQLKAFQQPAQTPSDAAPLWSDSTDPTEMDHLPLFGQTAEPPLLDKQSATCRMELGDERTSQHGKDDKPAIPETIAYESKSTYERILAGVEAVISRYSEESTSDVGALNEIPVQWPFPKHRRYKNALICLCKRQTVRSRVVSECQKCYDPACEIAGGWYHLKCLTEEELREVSSNSKWICRRCITRRETHGFPEIYALSIVEERRERLIRTVVAWSQTLPVVTRGNDGFTTHEKKATAKIDQRLKKAKTWPFPEDEQADDDMEDDNQEDVSISSVSRNASVEPIPGVRQLRSRNIMC